MPIEPRFVREDPGLPGWRCDFHMHTADEVRDVVPHSSVEMVELAARHEFAAIAITLHDRAFAMPEAYARAAELGVCLIPGIELTLEKRHVLALGLAVDDAMRIRSIDDLRAARREYGEALLVIAPHPFYVVAHSMNAKFHEWVELFDAVEVTRLQMRWLSRNGPAIAAARQYGLPLVCNSDTHHPRHFGRHYSRIEGEGKVEAGAIFRAIRGGKVTAVCPPVSLPWFVRELFDLFFVHPVLKAMREVK